MVRAILIIIVLFSSTHCFAEDKITTYTDENGQTIYTNEKQAPQSSFNTPRSQSPLRRSYQSPPIEFRDLPKPNSSNIQNRMPDPTINKPSAAQQPVFSPRPAIGPFEKLIATFTAFMGLMIFIGITFFVLWLISLIDILKSEFKGSNKIVWVIVVSIFPILGIILYYFIGLNQKKLPGIPDEFQ